jgi:hypothetical protein
MRESTSRLPSAEQPEPLSLVLLIRVFRAASAMSAVSSMTIVAFPAPTPYAGLPELYAAFTIAGPPVAMVRSAFAIRSLASGILGRSTHCSRSSGAPWRRSASRIRRTTSVVVFRLAGCGEKMTASLHLIA